ncbi:MAG: hypothetical protein QOH38_1786, partial [Thermoleophilaceae bacterium]|nr:hypothetical protein [Thermoleophilaceae bacterium]
MISAATTSRATLATLMTAVLLALVPAAAHADQYVVDHCTDFTSGAPRVAFGTFTGQTADTCGTQGGALLHQQGTLGANQTVEMALSIPADRPNIAIERVQTRYSSPGTTPGGAAGGSFAFLSLFNGSDQLVNNDVSGQPASPVVDLVLPRSRALRWTVYCTTLQTCIFSNDFLLHVNSTRLYLNEGAAPTLSVTGGTLVAASGKAGSQSLVFDAADVDSGVSSVTVSLDS